MILFGEHASSRGYPAIVFAINKRLTAELIINNKDNEIWLSSESLKIQNEKYPSSKLDLVSKTITLFFEKTELKKEPFKINFYSQIPAGFGSSAAVIVSTLGVLNKYFKTRLTEKEIMDLGIEANYSIKGYGSGLDIAAAIYGNLLKYKKGTIPEKLPFEELTFVIGSTGIKVDSLPLVNRVSKLETEQPQKAQTIFSSISEIVTEAILAINSLDLYKIGNLMNKNQDLLKMLCVSSPILEELISAALQGGALGAKLSGAGGGDNMIALVEEKNKERIVSAINQTRGKVIDDISIDPNGLLC